MCDWMFGGMFLAGFAALAWCILFDSDLDSNE